MVTIQTVEKNESGSLIQDANKSTVFNDDAMFYLYGRVKPK
jgi:hypothetical protein